MSDATIHDAKRDFSDIVRRTRNMKPKLRGTKKALEDIKKDAQHTLKQLEEIAPSINLQQRIENAGKIDLDTNPPTFEEIKQIEERQTILNELQDKKEQVLAKLDDIQQEEDDYKEHRSTQNTNKNLGKQVLVKALMGAGHLAKTLGTAYVMATLNAGRPEAGMGAEATMNRNNEQIFGSLGQLSTFNLGIGMMPMDMMGGMGGMMSPQMGGGMQMPFNPLGIGGGSQERPFDPMTAILQTMAASLNNTSPISFGGFEPQTSDKRDKPVSFAIGDNVIKFPNEESKNDFIDKYTKILEPLGTEKLPTQDECHKAEQELTTLFTQTARRAIGLRKLPSPKAFADEAKKCIEERIQDNLPAPLKSFYDIGIKTDENYTHFINNIDAPRINAYASVLKSINGNNDDFPNVQYKSLKEAIESNVNDDAKSVIISRNIDEKLGTLLKKQDYELLDKLFTNNATVNDVTSYANKLQECAKKTQTDAIKSSKQDESVSIKLEADSTDSTKKIISFTTQETANWVKNLFPKQKLDNGFSFYGQDIRPVTDTTGQTKYNGAFAFAVADKAHAEDPIVCSVKLDENPPISKEIYDFINKFLNDETGKVRDTKTEVKISKADILKFKDMCLKLPFPNEYDDGDLLVKKTIGLPAEGKKFPDFLKEKAKEEAMEMSHFARVI